MFPLFPQTEFRILRSPKKDPPEVDPKSIMELMSAVFEHGEEVTLEVRGKCEIMAAEFFKVAWENLANYADDVQASKTRLVRLIDETFSRILDPDIMAPRGDYMPISGGFRTPRGEECRGVATINDRLHDLSLPMIPLIAKHFGSSLEIAFQAPEQGIFSFTMAPQNGFELDLSILDLDIEVGTSITVRTWGPNRANANEAVRAVLQNLWQCDDWLRNQKGADLTSEDSIRHLLEFVDCIEKQQSSGYGSIQNPSISTLLAQDQVFINSATSQTSKKQALGQLIAPHAQKYGLQVASVLGRVESVELREGLVIAYAAMERTPRIWITFGVYPSGVVWDDTGKGAKLVAMVLFARDTYDTWRAYRRKMAMLFWGNPRFQEQLIASRTREEFLTGLRQTEKAMM